MKIGILTAEAFSTYMYGLVSDLYDSGFYDVHIVKLPQDFKAGLGSSVAKLGSFSLAASFVKFSLLIKAYCRWKFGNAINSVCRPLIKIPAGGDLVSFLRAEKFDLFIAYNSGLLDEDLLSIPRFGIICAHPSLLPFGRGFSGHLQSVLAGVPLGVTVFRISKGIDTGDIYLQEEIDISQCRSIDELRREFSRKEASLTVKVVLGINNSSLSARKQEKMIKYHRLTKEETDEAGRMLSSVFLQNKIRRRAKRGQNSKS